MIYGSLCELPDRYKMAIIKAVNLIIKRKIPGMVQIVLFGSCARLHLHVGSDIDLLIVTNEPLEDRRLLSYVRADLEFLPDDMRGDIVFSSIENLIKSNEKLYIDIRQDGIPLWKGGEFTDEYEQLLSASEE